MQIIMDTQSYSKSALIRKENNMSKTINGETWWYVGTTYDEDLVYDIYQNDRDETIYEVIDTLY